MRSPHCNGSCYRSPAKAEMWGGWVSGWLHEQIGRRVCVSTQGEM